MSSSTAFRSVPLGLCCLLAAGAGSQARAQSASPAEQVLHDKLVFDGGAFITTFQMKARLDGQSRSNPEYDFGKTFGGDNSNSTRLRADGLWRITPSQHIRFMYFNNSRTVSRTLSEDIDWGDNTYHVGAQVTLESKQQIVELAYEWAFLHKPSYEVAATLGVHYTDYSLRLSGNASTSGGATASFATATNTLPVPLPVLGLHAAWAASPRWYLDASGQFFKLKVGDYDGLITDLRANATWMFNRHVGAGLGYNIFTTTVDVTRNDFNGRLRFGYSGLQAFVKVGF